VSGWAIRAPRGCTAVLPEMILLLGCCQGSEWPGRSDGRREPGWAGRPVLVPAAAGVPGAQRDDAGGRDVSEAFLVHAVFVAGLRAVHEAAEASSYEADAADRQASAEADRAAARRRPSWADED
jgi:hypothetical protein